jgi:hypothetical protein
VRVEQDEEQEIRDVIAYIAKAEARGHATFTNAPSGPLRPMAERLKVQDWSQTMLNYYGAVEASVAPGPHPNDPPDCIAYFKIVGLKELRKRTVEYTELVRKEAIEAKKHGKSFDDSWTGLQLFEAIQARINAKTESYRGKGLSFDVLLIATDEPELMRTTIDTVLNAQCFTWGTEFHEVHFMMSYDPRTQNWPVWVLKKAQTKKR